MKKMAKISLLLLIVLLVISTIAFGADKKFVIKFGHGSTEINARHKAALMFKDIVENQTNGNVKVEIYPNEILGNEREMLESVQLNNLQMTCGGTGLFGGFYPQIGVIELPYIFDNFEQAWKILDGPFGKKLSEPLTDKGIHVLAYWENGFRQVTNSSRPINVPQDLKGIKIRTPEAPVYIGIFKALGANPTPMPFGELYMALRQGTVDGQENPLTNIYASKFYEVQKYCSLTRHMYSPLPLAISEIFWKKLPKEYQDIVQEAANKSRDYHRSLIKTDDENLVKELEKEGMVVNTPPSLEPFREGVQAVYEEFKPVFGDLIQELQKAAAAARQ